MADTRSDYNISYNTSDSLKLTWQNIFEKLKPSTENFYDSKPLHRCIKTLENLPQADM